QTRFEVRAQWCYVGDCQRKDFSFYDLGFEFLNLLRWSISQLPVFALIRISGLQILAERTREWRTRSKADAPPPIPLTSLVASGGFAVNLGLEALAAANSYFDLLGFGFRLLSQPDLQH